MKRLEDQEIFEIELLEWMKNKGFLQRLIFGGGTMLRLCHELNRFSIDLDFWSYRLKNPESYYEELNLALSEKYDITDAANKFNTILLEIRRPQKTGRLKIEIRKNGDEWDFEERIAFSTFSNRQVFLRVFTLEQMMKNKIAALIQRKEIRDAFDLEFILKKGLKLTADKKDTKKIQDIIAGFTIRDYKVTLGSLIEKSQRGYYAGNNFSFLLEKIIE